MNIQSIHYFNRYQQFILSRPERAYTVLSGLEKHHIKPKSLFPELKTDPTNIIVLTQREHYLAHWMLAKIYGGKMWFAFNQMRRVIPGDIKTSVLYDYARTYISSAISESNKGKPLSKRHKEKLSKFFLNKVPVRFKNEPYGTKGFLIDKTDPLFQTGEVIHCLVGRKNNKEALEKLKSNNGVRGKVLYHDPISLNVYYYNENDPNLPPHLIKGTSAEYRISQQIRMTGKKFYFDGTTGKHIRSANPLSGVLVAGRTFGMENGLAKMNDTNTKKVFDLTKGKIVIVNKLSDSEYWLCIPANGKLVQWRNWIVESTLLFSKLLDLNERLNPKKVIQSHHNSSDAMNKLALYYAGYTLNDVGVMYTPVKTFDISTIATYNLIRKENYEFKRNDFRRDFFAKSNIGSKN